MTPILEDRWMKLAEISLSSGSHTPDSEMCVMEAVAFVAGIEMGRLADSGMSQRKIAIRYGVKQNTVCRAIKIGRRIVAQL